MTRPLIYLACEGTIDQEVGEQLIRDAGGEPFPVGRRSGKSALDANLARYNEAARHGLWLVLRDLDHDSECAPAFIASRLPHRSQGLHLRLAIREIEAWLLADHDALADHFGLQPAWLPRSPDELDDAKMTMLQLFARSRRRTVREQLVRHSARGLDRGPLYSVELAKYILQGWDQTRASQASPSLERCSRRIREAVTSVTRTDLDQ